MKKHMILFVFVAATSINLFASQGLFMVVKGSVKTISKDNLETPAKVGAKVFAGDTVITDTDSRAKIVMSDRNVINISPNTKMKIEEYINEAKNKNVKISLLEGKIRNNVEQKYDNDKNKFEVKTPNAVAGVRGTQFITSYYEANKTTEVITLNGQVEFRSLTNAGIPSATAISVKKGERSEHTTGQDKPIDPIKLSRESLKEQTSETNVRNKEDGAAKDSTQLPAPAVQTPGAPTTKSPLIDGAIQNKYDKTKVKVDPVVPGTNVPVPPNGNATNPNKAPAK